jgi:lipoyl(octanoyl) transferase
VPIENASVKLAIAANSDPPACVLRELGLRDYAEIWEAMRRFTDTRQAATPDEVWLVEHPPVFTLGMAGKTEHLLAPGDIPVVKTDRGGQVTYHGPGQAMLYVLWDLKRLGLSIRRLVEMLEQSVIDYCGAKGISAVPRAGAPGVYVAGRKLAALGLRVRRGCCYHGLALNVDMDLEPFSRINPCGYPGLEVTQLRDLDVPDGVGTVGRDVAESLCRRLAKASAPALHG